MVKAYSPAEARAAGLEAIPDDVVNVVNELIAEQANSSSEIRIRQCDVLSALDELEHDRQQIFNRHWLDFEGLYRAQGWIVTYDKPAYNESYEPNWTFVAAGS